VTAACFVTALLCALPAPMLRGAERFMPVDEVKAGMRGTGISVFEGETRAEFQVEVLGTLPNAVGPRRHLILARLSGERLRERFGIALPDWRQSVASCLQEIKQQDQAGSPAA